VEILIVIASLFVCFAFGVAIAYALDLAALAGAYWIGIPLEPSSSRSRAASASSPY
jgi:hypothetical protein